MIEPDLSDFSGKNILIVEDDYLLAEEMAREVERVGAVPIGPVPDVEGARALIAAHHVDAAILDIKLGSDTSFPVAEALRAKSIPVVFMTGYDDWYVPDDLQDIPIYQKPTDPRNVVRLMFAGRNGR